MAYPRLEMRRRGRPRHPDILTPREWEVLALVRRGLSNREIGRRLGISPAGAKYHVAEVISKLGVGSRQEAVMLLTAGEGAVVQVASGWRGGDRLCHNRGGDNRPHRVFGSGVGGGPIWGVPRQAR